MEHYEPAFHRRSWVCLPHWHFVSVGDWPERAAIGLPGVNDRQYPAGCHRAAAVKLYPVHDGEHRGFGISPRLQDLVAGEDDSGTPAGSSLHLDTPQQHLVLMPAQEVIGRCCRHVLDRPAALLEVPGGNLHRTTLYQGALGCAKAVSLPLPALLHYFLDCIFDGVSVS